MLRLMIVAMVLASALSASVLDVDREWVTFKKTHNKLYDSPQTEAIRQAIWEKNLKMIVEHNLEADRGRHTFRLGMNYFGDMTNKEITTMLNGYKMSPNRTAGAAYLPPSNVGAVPSEVDWRKKGYVTPVKNQLQCGSCWAFSATGSLEGQHFKKSGTLVSLSEQNLVDCSKKEGNQGCEGGLMDQAFTYIKKNRGIDTEKSYPYKAKDERCHFKRADVGATDSGYMDIRSGSEEALKSAVATVGPISVAIDASHSSFQFYQSGVYYEPRCSSRSLDHGVLAVGYGSVGTKDLWLVKNSWGTSWGMEGYIQMARNRDNNCGIATQASYPTV
ncbi:cathepsin L-like peptidase isoform X1 [Babylonia areolata]|uniref:cathepsin L-like peptidase isoform X1 n=1 Tax=Babylonia areolata TaxID=304850 RepID=UPI003FD370EE